MIIWIDGTYGIGKTTVSFKVKEKLCDKKIKFLDSDFYWINFLRSFIGGKVLPQTNEKFLREFKDMIVEKSEHEDIIIAMSITQKECKTELFDHLISMGRNILHIILVANEDTIKSRIEHDDVREDKKLALDNLHSNILFLNANFIDAIRINTDNRSASDIANDIVAFINSWSIG